MYGPADYVVTHERFTGGDTGIGKWAPAECRRAGKPASVALPVHEDNCVVYCVGRHCCLVGLALWLYVGGITVDQFVRRIHRTLLFCCMVNMCVWPG